MCWRHVSHMREKWILSVIINCQRRIHFICINVGICFEILWKYIKGVILIIKINTSAQQSNTVQQFNLVHTIRNRVWIQSIFFYFFICFRIESIVCLYIYIFCILNEMFWMFEVFQYWIMEWKWNWSRMVKSPEFTYNWLEKKTHVPSMSHIK